MLLLSEENRPTGLKCPAFSLYQAKHNRSAIYDKTPAISTTQKYKSFESPGADVYLWNEDVNSGEQREPKKEERGQQLSFYLFCSLSEDIIYFSRE